MVGYGNTNTAPFPNGICCCAGMQPSAMGNQILSRATTTKFHTIKKVVLEKGAPKTD